MKHAVLQSRLNPVGVDRRRQRKGPLELAIGPLNPVIVFLLGFLLELTFAAENQIPLINMDVDLILFKTWHLSGKFECVRSFTYIHRWNKSAGRLEIIAPEI